jgi:L-fucose isomerase-like protein
MGKVRQNGAHRARPDGRQSQAGRDGFRRGSQRAQRHRAGFQGQRQWTDYQPNGDFLEAILNTSFDWNGIRAPYIVATENDCLNGASMLFGYLLTNTAQIFADVRTYWSPDAVKRVAGHKLAGAAAGGILHLINSGRPRSTAPASRSATAGR